MTDNSGIQIAGEEIGDRRGLVGTVVDSIAASIMCGVAHRLDPEADETRADDEGDGRF
jgi:hypothetical protein